MLDKVITTIMVILFASGAIVYTTLGVDIIHMTSNFFFKLGGGFMILGGFSLLLLVIQFIKECFPSK